MTVVAEGVQTQEQAALQALGVRCGQGLYLGSQGRFARRTRTRAAG